MVYSLSRSPTKKAEEHFKWWEDRLHNRRCDNCESWVPLSGVNTSASGVYCSEICWHMHEETLEFQRGEI